MSDDRETRFPFHLPSGRIIDGAPEPPVEEVWDASLEKCRFSSKAAVTAR
jgi:hypothetical protein